MRSPFDVERYSLRIGAGGFVCMPLSKSSLRKFEKSVFNQVIRIEYSL